MPIYYINILWLVLLCVKKLFKNFSINAFHVSWKDKNTNVWGPGKDWNRFDHQKGNHGKKTKTILGTLLGDLKVLRSKYCKEQSKEKRGRGRPPISWTDDIKKVSGK